MIEKLRSMTEVIDLLESGIDKIEGTFVHGGKLFSYKAYHVMEILRFDIKMVNNSKGE